MWSPNERQESINKRTDSCNPECIVRRPKLCKLTNNLHNYRFFRPGMSVYGGAQAWCHGLLKTIGNSGLRPWTNKTIVSSGYDSTWYYTTSGKRRKCANIPVPRYFVLNFLLVEFALSKISLLCFIDIFSRPGTRS